MACISLYLPPFDRDMTIMQIMEFLPSYCHATLILISSPILWLMSKEQKYELPFTECLLFAVLYKHYI